MFSSIGYLSMRAIEFQYFNEDKDTNDSIKSVANRRGSKSIFSVFTGYKSEIDPPKLATFYVDIRVFSKEDPVDILVQTSQQFSCAYMGGNCLIGEEFSINNLSTSSIVMISFYRIRESNEMSSNNNNNTKKTELVGIVHIPVKRLQADTTVSFNVIYNALS